MFSDDEDLYGDDLLGQAWLEHFRKRMRENLSAHGECATDDTVDLALWRRWYRLPDSMLDPLWDSLKRKRLTAALRPRHERLRQQTVSEIDTGSDC